MTQLANGARNRRPSSTELWRLAWSVGGRSQRRFALLAAAAPSTSAALMAVAMVCLYARGGIEEVYELFYVGFIAIAAWPAYQKAVSAPMYGSEFWKTKIARGWVPQVKRDFYEELARYKAECGIGGQLSGDVAWGAGYTVIYLSTMIIAITMVWLLPSWSSVDILISFSLLEFPLAFACIFLYGRRNRRQFDQAVSSGYRFASSRLGALHRLQP